MTHYALLPNELVLGTPPDYTLHRLLSKKCRVLKGGCRSPWVSLHPPSRPSRAFYRVAALVAVTTVAFLVYICSALIAGPLSKWPVGRRLGSGHSSEVAGHSSEVTPGEDRDTTQPCVIEKLPAYSKAELSANLSVDSERLTSRKALGVSLPTSSQERAEHAAGRKESTPEGVDSTVHRPARKGKRKLQFSLSEQKQTGAKRQTKAAKVQSQEQLPNCASSFHQNSGHSSQEGEDNLEDAHHKAQTRMTNSPRSNAGASLQGSPQLSGLTSTVQDVLKNIASPESYRILRSMDIFLERLLEDGDGVHFETSCLDLNSHMPRRSHFDGNISLPPPGQSSSYPEESDNAAFPGASIDQGGVVAGTNADYLSARFSPDDATSVDAWLHDSSAHKQDGIPPFRSILQDALISDTSESEGLLEGMAGRDAAGLLMRTNTLPLEQPVGCMSALCSKDKLPGVRLCALPACDTPEPSEAVTKDSQPVSSSLVGATPNFAVHSEHVRTPQDNLAGAKLKTSPLRSTTKLPSGNPSKGSLRASVPDHRQDAETSLQKESALHAKVSSTISSADAAVKSSATRLLSQNVVETGRQRRSGVLVQVPSSKCPADPEQAPAIYRSNEIAQRNAKTTHCSGDTAAGRPSQVPTKKMHMSADASTPKQASIGPNYLRRTILLDMLFTVNFVEYRKHISLSLCRVRHYFLYAVGENCAQGTASSELREAAASISLRIVRAPPGGSHFVLRQVEQAAPAAQLSDLEVRVLPQVLLFYN